MMRYRLTIAQVKFRLSLQQQQERLRKFHLLQVGVKQLINDTPSPPVTAVNCAWFNTFAALTCFVLDIDLARALVYLAAKSVV